MGEPMTFPVHDHDTPPYRPLLYRSGTEWWRDGDDYVWRIWTREQLIWGVASSRDDAREAMRKAMPILEFPSLLYWSREFRRTAE